MGRQSSVERLDPTLVDTVNGLIRKGRTIDEIVAALQPLGAEVSRSAMGRYVKSARDSMEKYRQAQEVAKVWTARLEEDPNGDVGRLLNEMLRTVAFDTVTRMNESEKAVKAGDIMFLAKALKDISGASKLNVDLELQLRKVRVEAKAAAQAVATTAKKAGLSEETVDAIRAKILGIGAAA